MDAWIPVIAALLGFALGNQQIVFAKLQEKRVLIVADAYRLIRRAESTIQDLVNPLQEVPHGSTIEEVEYGKRKLCVEAGIEMADFLRDNQIWFEPETVKKIDDFRQSHFATWTEFRARKWLNKADPSYLAQWSKCSDLATKEVPKLREVVEREFRSLVGVRSV
jgi:hypothetical protein